jgi:hypothetical protein
MNRTALSILSLIGAAALSACATTDAPPTGYTADLDRLNADCRARGGILTSTGATTGRAETENACLINNSSRLE